MQFFNFWNHRTLNEGADSSGGFSSRVEDYGETEGMDTAIESYDPDEEQDLDGNDTSQEVHGGSEDTASPNGSANSKEPSFSPYEFKGKVNGEELSHKFETKKDMDVAIARGLQAPKIYEALQSAKAEISRIREDAQWANDLQALAKDSPKEFFEHVVEELMDEKALAEYVYGKHQEFTRLANLSPEELQRERQLKAADKLMREQAHSEQKRQEAEAAQQKARVEQEKAELAGWQNKERQVWEAKLPANLKGHLDEYMRAAMLTAQAHLNAGQQYGLKEMSAHLKRLLSPLTSNPQNPTQVKREEANQNRANAEANKQRLQNLAKGNEQSTSPRVPMKKKDLWNNLKRDVFSQIGKE